ncbi:hypothetical protein ACET3Z_001472 [Daucus carota]
MAEVDSHLPLTPRRATAVARRRGSEGSDNTDNGGLLSLWHERRAHRNALLHQRVAILQKHARPAEDKNQVGEWYNARAQKDADQSASSIDVSGSGMFVSGITQNDPGTITGQVSTDMIGNSKRRRGPNVETLLSDNVLKKAHSQDKENHVPVHVLGRTGHGLNIENRFRDGTYTIMRDISNRDLNPNLGSDNLQLRLNVNAPPASPLCQNEISCSVASESVVKKRKGRGFSTEKRIQMREKETPHGQTHENHSSAINTDKRRQSIHTPSLRPSSSYSSVLTDISGKEVLRDCCTSPD